MKLVPNNAFLGSKEHRRKLNYKMKVENRIKCELVVQSLGDWQEDGKLKYLCTMWTGPISGTETIRPLEEPRIGPYGLWIQV